MNLLQIFNYSFQEYKKMTEISEVKLEKFENTPRVYTSINLRLMLMRKFITPNKDVYIIEVLTELIGDYPMFEIKAKNLMARFLALENSKTKHRLSTGKEVSVLDTVFDTIYGLNLHSDAKRIRNIESTDFQLINTLTFKFVTEFEPLLYETYEIIQNLDLVENKKTHDIAPIISLEPSDNNSRKIRNSPFWSNIDGDDLTDDLIASSTQSMDEAEQNALSLITNFFELLRADNLDLVELRKCVTTLSSSDWGNFEEAKSFISKIENIGISNTFRYSKNMKNMYVYIFPNTPNGFTIKSATISTNIFVIRLKKRWMQMDYRIYSIGGEIPKEYIIKKEINNE